MFGRAGRLLWTSLPLRALIGVVLTALILLGMQPAPAPPENLRPERSAVDAAAQVAASPAVEMWIPSIELVAAFEEGPCRVRDGAIDPASLSRACTYTAADRPYSLPASDAADLVVVAGHTGAGLSAVFDELYDGANDRHTVSLGERLYLRTEASGARWLVYEATDLHDPAKEGLAQDPEVWGDSATPGRLLTISCIQPANPLAVAARNAVVGWQYLGVVEESPAGAEAGADGEPAYPPPYPGFEPGA
ncbi:hypothetical protein CGUA_02490 [Corynebacterium guangdongense]|nr:hypothetical protein CGUA_02490 [Corynebacterium guangdongense]